MELIDARREFEKCFKRFEVGLREDKDLDWACSGGLSKEGVMPVLFLDKDVAVSAWLDFVKLLSPARDAILEWLIVPELMEFQMTMADRLGRHRIVSNRFAVRSQYKVHD